MVADEACRTRVREDIARLQTRPQISLLLPVARDEERLLRATVESIGRQLYRDWQVFIAVPAALDARCKARLAEYSRTDSRIEIVHAETLDMGALANAAMAAATGGFVAVLEQGVELSEFALYLFAKAINKHIDSDLLYCDEDVIYEDGRHGEPFFKPGWDPELLLGQDYFNRLGVYRRALVVASGGLRSGLDGTHAWDLVLRCAQKTHVSRIHRIPVVLHHRRKGPPSYRGEGAVDMVQQHLDRNGEHAVVIPHPAAPGMCKTRFVLGERRPRVSLIIPSRDQRELLEKCITSIRDRTSYRSFEIVVVDNQTADPAALQYLDDLQHSGSARVLRYDHPFNWSAINNFAVAECDADVVGLVNNDIEVVSPGWLADMAALAMRPAVGAVGAMLTFPDGSVQHAGIVLGITGAAGHIFKGLPATAAGYFGRLQLLQNYSAVTGACLLVRRDRYIEAGGLDEDHLPIAFNDVDFCLKLRKRGYRNLWTPDAVLVHHESVSRGYEDTPAKRARLAEEERQLRARWAEWLADDPCYNPNLTLHREDSSLAWPPRMPGPCDIEP
jgi:GT2 family glycosyltransferase